MVIHNAPVLYLGIGVEGNPPYRAQTVTRRPGGVPSTPMALTCAFWITTLALNPKVMRSFHKERIFRYFGDIVDHRKPGFKTRDGMDIFENETGFLGATWDDTDESFFSVNYKRLRFLGS